VDQPTEEGITKYRSTVEWVITHTLVIKEVSKYLNFKMPEHYEFLQWVALRSHGAKYPISFMAVGDGASDPDILQSERKNRGHKKENVEKKDKRRGEEKNVEPRRQGGGQEERRGGRQEERRGGREGGRGEGGGGGRRGGKRRGTLRGG